MNNSPIHLTIITLAFGVNLYILNYIMNLEKSCECSNDWRRPLIKYYIIITMIAYLLMIFGYFYNLPLTVQNLLPLLGLICTGLVFFYIRKLKEIKCTCSEGTARNILEYANYINIAVYSLSFILLLYIVMIYFRIASRSK